MTKPKDVDSYIADSDMEARSILSEVRKLITSTIPLAEEGISYNVPFYKYHGELVGLSTAKKHVSFGFGSEVLREKDRCTLERKGYKLGKGTLQIKFDQKVPVREIKKILKEKAKLNETHKMYE